MSLQLVPCGNNKHILCSIYTSLNIILFIDVQKTSAHPDDIHKMNISLVSNFCFCLFSAFLILDFISLCICHLLLFLAHIYISVSMPFHLHGLCTSVFLIYLVQTIISVL